MYHMYHMAPCRPPKPAPHAFATLRDKFFVFPIFGFLHFQSSETRKNVVSDFPLRSL